LLISLIVGIVVGSLKKFSGKAKKYVSSCMTVLVFVLILLMGYKTGSNQAVISNLGVYGLQSLFISIAAIVGSIIFAILFERLILKDGVK
jgi:uncharacterized membrane protein YbjE (DUF340 family)